MHYDFENDCLLVLVRDKIYVVENAIVFSSPNYQEDKSQDNNSISVVELPLKFRVYDFAKINSEEYFLGCSLPFHE